MVTWFLPIAKEPLGKSTFAPNGGIENNWQVTLMTSAGSTEQALLAYVSSACQSAAVNFLPSSL